MLENTSSKIDIASEEIRTLFSGANDFKTAIPQLLSLLASRFKCQWVVYWKIDGNVMSCEDLCTDPSFNIQRLESDSRNRIFSIGEGMPGKVWRSGTAEKSSDVSKDMALPRSLKAHSIGMVEGVWFPVRTNHSVFGVIEMLSTRKRTNDSELLPSLEKLGRNLGDLIVERFGPT